MTARLPDFRASLAAEDSSNWLSSTYQAYFDTFTGPEPTEKDLEEADGDEKKAKKIRQQAREKVSHT